MLCMAQNYTKILHLIIISKDTNYPPLYMIYIMYYKKIALLLDFCCLLLVHYRIELKVHIIEILGIVKS